MIIWKYVQEIAKKLYSCKSIGHENFEAMRFCFGHDGHRKNDRKCAVVWPWLVLEHDNLIGGKLESGEIICISW